MVKNIDKYIINQFKQNCSILEQKQKKLKISL